MVVDVKAMIYNRKYKILLALITAGQLFINEHGHVAMANGEGSLTLVSGINDDGELIISDAIVSGNFLNNTFSAEKSLFVKIKYELLHIADIDNDKFIMRVTKDAFSEKSYG